MLDQLEAGLGPALLRGVSVAGSLSLFGALLYGRCLAPLVLAPAGFWRPWRYLVWGSLAVALTASLFWLIQQAAMLADATRLADVAPAVRDVVVGTRFGAVVVARLAALLVCGAMLWRGWSGAATIFAALAVLLQAGHGHAVAMQDGLDWLLVSGVVHLLAAGAWLGGLAPLLLLVRVTSPQGAWRACRDFAPLGSLCVLALAVSALVQSATLVGGLAGLIGTAHGRVALVKSVLFLALLALAARHRWRLAPALLGTDPAGTRRALLCSIGTETAAGLLVNLPPAMHLQPDWPFTIRPSLDTINDDDNLHREVLLAAAMVLAALAAWLAAIWLRRLRLGLGAAGAVLLWWGLPAMSLLLVPAYPTSYYRSPTGFAAAAIVAGAALYPTHCAACHGAGGQGGGPLAAGLAVPPADLTAPHLWMHTDGELFWWLSDGMAAPNGERVMPGFAASLSDRQRWELIDFLRARNAGLALHTQGDWPQPVPAPGFQAVCDGRSLLPDALRGQFVRVVIGHATQMPGVLTVQTAPDAPAGVCVADTPALPAAIGLVTGQTPEGEAVLIDPDGWLRAVGHDSAWNDPQALAAIVARLRAHRIGVPAGGGMSHAGMKMD